MRAQSQAAAVSAPATPGGLARVARPRLERLVTASAAPITVLISPAGCGKSDLLRAVGNNPRTICFRVGYERGTFARFVHGLAQRLAPVAPGAGASFARAWEHALQSRSPGATLAHWLCEHLQGVDHPLVFDDLHDAAADPSIAAFIAKLDELRPNSSLTIALRSIGALPSALWMATGRMEQPIEETRLRFNAIETHQAARQFGLSLDPTDIAALLSATRGLPVAINYALAQLRCDSRAFSLGAAPATFEEVAAAMYARRSGRQRALLFTAALFSNFDEQLLSLCGYEDAAELMTAMSEDAPFMWERDGPGTVRLYDRFREYLARQFASHDLAFRSAIANRVLQSLRLTGQYGNALDIATRQRFTAMIGELLDDHGYEMLESGEIDVIGDALDALDLREGSLGAKISALRGYLDARRGRFDTAEAWFRLGLKNAQDESARVAIALYYTRELTLRRREDACEALAPFVDSPTLPRPMLLDVRSAYAQGLAAANRLEEAQSRTAEVFAMLQGDESPALRARVFARAAYVAIESDALPLARERALIAAPLAIAESLYGVAASTYSVLYNIAYGNDEAETSLEYLRCVRDMGLKSGTLRYELYALLGMYELNAEMGDETALSELGRQIAAADKHEAGADIMEALLPAKALQAAWAADFEAAAHLVLPTAEHYATPERRALSWAQIGVYRAAQGDAERANDAIRTAHETLPYVEVKTALFPLTLVTLGLAKWAGGEFDAAREWLNAADRTTVRAPRARALRDALEALISASTQTGRLGSDVASALAKLRAAAFGGMARLIEALPYRSADAAGAGRTIGTVLAREQFTTHLEAAAAHGDSAGLRAWLDALPGSVERELSISHLLDEWAARRESLEPRMRAVIRELRRAVAAHRPSVPVFVRLVDDVDESIGALFGRFEIVSPLMGEHSRAVSAWCSRIARTLGLPETQREFVMRSGLIHDIGKMLTPPDILNAPRGLSSAEWPIMKDHAADGARIISDVDHLRSFIPIVRGHHERLDGKGYPDGLRLSAIPLEARIVAVADSFNAMIARRPYRLPMPPNEALDELDRNCETQFDPEIVAAMVHIVLSRPAERG